ncbi:MAG: nucleotidyltransferase domain-containing protein [Planctomycetaceae bacterium]
MSEFLELPITLPEDRLAAFCERWGIAEMALFGSVLRDDFGPESDIDLLAEFRPGTKHTFADLDAMEAELREMVGRKVDLVDKTVVTKSDNYIRRKEILRSAHVIFDSRSGISAGHAHRGPAGTDFRAGT